MIRRFIGITSPYSKFAEDVEEIKELDAYDRFLENTGLDTVVYRYLFEDTASRRDIINYIRKDPVTKKVRDIDTQDRLETRFEFSEAIKDIPNRSFWLALRGIPGAKARARLYVMETRKMSDSTVKELQEGMRIIEDAGGVISDDFIDEVLLLRKETRSPE